MGQVWARFCDFKGKTGVNGGEGMESYVNSYSVKIIPTNNTRTFTLMNIPFKIFPTTGFKNSQFQILINNNSIEKIEIEYNGKIIKQIKDISDNNFVLTELKNAGKYIAKCYHEGKVYEQIFEIFDSIRLGSGELKQCYTFDEIEYDFYLMKDRLLIYHKEAEKLFTENYFPSEIHKIDKNYLLFITKYIKNGEDCAAYAIYSLASFEIEFELNKDYTQILFNEDDCLLWIKDVEERMVIGYDLRNFNNNLFQTIKYNYEKVYYHAKGYCLFIETKKNLIICSIKTKKEISFEKDENLSLDNNGTIILNYDDRIVIKNLSNEYQTEFSIKKQEEFKFDTNDFFYLDKKMICENEENAQEKYLYLINKHKPSNEISGDYFKKYLTGDERITSSGYVHQFYPFKDEVYIVKVTKSKTLSSIIYRKRNSNVWQDDIEIKSDVTCQILSCKRNGPLVTAYTLKEVPNIIYSKNKLLFKLSGKTIVLDINSNEITEIGVVIKYLKTTYKEYIFLEAANDSMSIIDLDKIGDPISVKCQVFNLDNFNKSKVLWFANLSNPEYISLDSLELYTGKPIPNYSDDLKELKYKSINEVEFNKTFFKIKNLGLFDIKTSKRISGIVGEIVSSSESFTKVISRRSNILYLNTLNINTHHYESNEIDLPTNNYDEAYLSPNGQFLVLKKSSDEYSLFDIELNEETRFFSGKFLSFSNEGNIIYQEGTNRSAVVIDPLTFENITPDNYHYYRFVSPDGKLYSQLSNSIRYYHNIKKEYVSKEKYDELRDLLSPYSKKYVRSSNGNIEFRQWYFEKYNEYFKDKNIDDISYVLVENIIDARKYIEIGIVGTDVKVPIEFPKDLTFYNYSAFSYDNMYFAYVGKPSDRGLIVFIKIYFDEKNKILEIKETREIRKPRKAAWVCAFSSNGYFATYDSIPVTFLIKMGDNFFEEKTDLLPNEPEKNGVLFTKQNDWTEIPRRNFLCFSASGSLIALSNQGYDPISIGGNGHRSANSLHIALTETGKIKFSFNDHGALIKTDMSKKIIFVAFSEDESKIMSLSTDGVVIVRNLN